MRKEYPPMLTGQPEEQLKQLRAYLVRLVGYIDEAVTNIPTGGATDTQWAALAEWERSVNNAIGSLRTAARELPLVQHGEASAAGDIIFPKNYAGIPAVFTTAGTASDVSVTGFTLTTSTAAHWIAVGDPVRR